MSFERQLAIFLFPIWLLFAVWVFFFCRGLWRESFNERCELGHLDCADCVNCVYCDREWEKENLNMQNVK